MKLTQIFGLLALAAPFTLAAADPFAKPEACVKVGQSCSKFGESKCCCGPTNSAGEPNQRCDCFLSGKQYFGGRTCGDGKMCSNGRCVPSKSYNKE